MSDARDEPHGDRLHAGVSPHDARRLLERADVLGAISETPDNLTRRFATPALARAVDTVAGWMSEAGMTVQRDAVGNLIGRYEGADPATGALVLGSHLDTVRGAGRYDGVLGVLAALAVVERLATRDELLSCALEVVGFADEEGVRFGAGYLGSSAWSGSFDPSLLELVDDEGVTIAEAIRLAGGDPAAVTTSARRPDDLLGYLELHIEQGPVLDDRGLPVGVVSAIVGQTRARVTLRGRAGHAGTVPMALRRDALAGAAELVLAVERLARSEPGAVATVGTLDVVSGASNVVPGTVVLSVDVRHADDAVRGRLSGELAVGSQVIAAARGLDVTWEVLQETAAVDMSPRLTAALARAAAARGLEAPLLVSGAGHDAAIVSRVVPAAMLFVRCAGGVSHSPEESIDEEDVAVALDVLEAGVRLIAVETAGAGDENGG